MVSRVAGLDMTHRYKRLTCACPARCKFCGAKRKRDIVGHRCPTKNCQWEHGYPMCLTKRTTGDGEIKA